MKFAGKRWAVGGLVAVVLLAGGLGLWQLVEQGARAAMPLPPLEPLPNYLGVYPQPGQVIRNAAPSGIVDLLVNDTADNLGVDWHIGEVCVIILADKLIPPGANWDASDVVQRTQLTIDSKPAGPRVRVIDGLIETTISIIEMAEDGTIISTQPVATVGGPYVLCWPGPTTLGAHRATIAFEQRSYQWWYVLSE